LGSPIDLGNVNIPVYLQATAGDHIAPAESVFKATKLYSGRVRFVLGGSGHIAGVINSPKTNKYQYWLNGKRKKYDSVATWKEDAVEHSGSWWPDWGKWLSTKSGGKVPARKIGSGKLKSLEPAPGSYVKVRS
jgi:polyhydroxyalkanoate synthase